MAAAVVYRLADVARSPILPPYSCATRVRINPACVARPEDAAARDAKRRRRRGEERPRSPDVKRRRRRGNVARGVSPVTSRKREAVEHRRNEDSSPESKRRRRDDARRASPDGKRKRDSVVDDGQRGSSSASSRSSFGGPRPAPARSHLDHAARRTAKIQEHERAQDTTTWRRSRRSGSALSEPRARPNPCAAQAQQLQVPVAAIERRREVSMNGQPLHELERYTESFEEIELRRRETQQKREEARREMDKVVQTVYFNDPYISLLDILKR